MKSYTTSSSSLSPSRPVFALRAARVLCSTIYFRIKVHIVEIQWRGSDQCLLFSDRRYSALLSSEINVLHTNKASAICNKIVFSEKYQSTSFDSNETFSWCLAEYLHSLQCILSNSRYPAGYAKSEIMSQSSFFCFTIHSYESRICDRIAHGFYTPFM